MPERIQLIRKKGWRKPETNRWSSILDLFAWNRRWAVYDSWAYVWEPVVYKPQPITFDRERPTYGELHPLARYSYAGLVASPAVTGMLTLSTQ